MKIELIYEVQKREDGTEVKKLREIKKDGMLATLVELADGQGVPSRQELDKKYKVETIEYEF